MKKITIEDVAKHTGVSKGTVSAVINAKNTVKAVTRNHVLEGMKELHYRPKGVARNLKNSRQDKSIGIIIKDLSYPLYTSIALGAKNKNQVAENVHASALPPLSNEIMKSVKSLYERFIKEKVHHYW